MNKPKTAYQVMTSILTTYKPSLEEKMSISSYFMCRYLSSNSASIFVGNFINRYYSEIPVNIQYDISKQILNGKIKWIQLPRKDKNDNKTIDNISVFYKVSYITAVEYYNLMSDKERDRFHKIYDGQ